MRGWIILALALASWAAPAAADHRADLAVLRDDYVRKGRAFTPQTRQAALDYLASLEPRADALSNAEFLIAIAKTVALADNGHDAWHPDGGAWMPERAPVRLFWFPDALVVARASAEQRDLPGARITAIDGHPVEELFERLRTLSGGTDDYRRWHLTQYLERAELLHALGLAASPDRMSVSLVLREGTTTLRDLEMIPRDTAPGGAGLGRLLSAEAYHGEKVFGWTGPPATAEEPLYLRDPDRLFRFVDLPAIAAGYLQFRSHYGSVDEPIGEFVRSAREQLARTKPENLIVDLRFDGGGDIDPTVDFFRGLAAAVPGRIYVIVSRYTFSAGIVAAALIEQSAGDRAMIVGEPVGDRLRFWSEGRPVCLPESKYCVQVTDGLWDLVNGCAQEPGCYGDAFHVKVPDLDPDLAAPLTADSWFAGTDPAMTAIEAHLWSCKSCRPEPGDGN